MSTSPFPPGFLWGVATSAQQVEGAPDEGGRGESVWDRFAATPGRIHDGSDARVACDHYHHWREDVERLAWLGVNAYRFSISWPRILPTGAGAVNPAGLDFYDALTDALLASGIQPFVTLDHWDLPQALMARGGWVSRDTVSRFVDFTEAVSARLGDRVGHWVTHNEPWCVAQLGHAQGEHAPGLERPADALRVAHHLMLSHGRAVGVLRRNSPRAQVGMVNLYVPVHPASDSALDRDAARQADGTFNRWYLDPIFGRGYPRDVVEDRVRRGELDSPELPFVQPGDLEAIAVPTDFLGVNYYSRNVVRAGTAGRPEAVAMVPAARQTAMGWEVYADGLHESLLRVTREYRPARVHITENGAAFDDAPGDPVADPRRVDYLRAHVAAAARALADGVPLGGYFVWSFMDNFEWAQGLSKRFGLFHVDFATQQRTPRDSAWWYRELVTRGGVEAPARDPDPRRHP